MSGQEFREVIARWVDERLAPQAEALDRSAEFPRELFKEAGKLGFIGVMYPEKYGGSGVPNPYTCFSIVCEELARGSMGFAAGVCMQGSTATHTIFQWGAEALRERFLVGIGLYLVDTKTPGFSVGRRLEKFSVHCSDTAELVFDSVFVPEECQLGGGDGAFLNAYRSLTVDRIFTAALALGTGRAAYEAALKYAKERSQFGQPIGKFQAVQFKLVDMLATLEQARLYTYHAAALADQGRPITTEAALAKIIAADGCNAICQKALNIFGGYGLMNEFAVQRYLRDSYFPMIGGGTSDIMRLVVARQLGL